MTPDGRTSSPVHLGLHGEIVDRCRRASRKPILVSAYIALIVYGSLLPFNFRPMPFSEAVECFANIENLSLGASHRADWLANLFHYVPLGFLGTNLFALKRRRVATCVLAATIAAALAALLAVAIEFVQLWYPPRTVSWNDLLAEVVGAAAGAAASLGWDVLGPGVKRKWRLALKTNASRLGVLYVAGLVVLAAAPFDFVLNAHEFRQKLNRGGLCLIPLRDMRLETASVLSAGLHALTFAPIGWWLLRRRTSDRRDPAHLAGDALIIAIVGGVLAFLFEVLKLVVFSRHASATAIVTGSLGAASGAMLYRCYSARRHPPNWLRMIVLLSKRRVVWLGLSAVYSLAIAAVMFAPFHLITDSSQISQRWASFRHMPFAIMYYNSEFGALTSIMYKGLPFALLGVMLSRAASSGANAQSLSQFVTIMAMCVAGLLGVAIEIGQVYVNSHQPDMTDILIYALFAAVGANGNDFVRRRLLSNPGPRQDATRLHSVAGGEAPDKPPMGLRRSTSL